MSTETAPGALKRTALYPEHLSLGAKLGPFGGWVLPISYSSILKEHETVRTAVGIFDVSHLGHLEVTGEKGLEQLQPLVTQNLTRLEVGRAIYTPMLNPQGAILDEMIFYRLSPSRIRMVVNAANGDNVRDWVQRHLSGGVQLTDLREKVGTIAVQGPKAVALVEQLAKEPLAFVPRYSVRAGYGAGRSAWFARTGYTGEDGFELFLPMGDLTPVWRGLLGQGRSFGVQPIGLGARDTLRLEAGLPLGGADLDERTTPLEAGLDWTVAWDKGPFIGREQLERQKAEGVSRRLVGFRLKGSGIPRHGYPILYKDRPAGQVTSGTLLPSQGPIGLGYVPPEAASPGTEIAIGIHGRQVPAGVVQLPFYRRKKE